MRFSLLSSLPWASSFRSLDDLGQTPALVLAQRARLHDANGVTLIRFIVLIVSHQLRGALDKFPVDRVLDLALDSNADALIHLAAHHDPNAFLAVRVAYCCFLCSHSLFLSFRNSELALGVVGRGWTTPHLLPPISCPSGYNAIFQRRRLPSH